MSATLNPNHADDTGLLGGPAPLMFSDQPHPDVRLTTHASITPSDGAFVVGMSLDVASRRGRMEAYPLSRDGLRQMRALIDRALGDRT